MKVDIEMTQEELNKVTELARPAQGNPVLELLPLLMMATFGPNKTSENRADKKDQDMSGKGLADSNTADVGTHDNMQMTVEKFNELIAAARAERPLYEAGKRALAISIISYISALKFDDVSEGQAYEVIEMLDKFNMLDRESVLRYLEARSQEK